MFIAENKPKPEKPENQKKVRHTRWNDEPPVQVMPLLNPAFAASMGGAFNTLTLQDQQKIQEYTMNYQMKGFYSEQDQDMRINRCDYVITQVERLQIFIFYFLIVMAM